MSLSIITYPRTSKSDGHSVRMSNGYNAVYFDIARTDISITATGVNSGYLMLTLASVTGLTLQQSVYIAVLDAGSNLVKSGEYQIWAIDSVAKTISLITGPLDPPNLGASGTVNILSSGKKEIEVSGTVNDGVWDINITARRFSYDSTGTVRVYLTSILRDLFVKNYEIDTSVTNHLIQGASLMFNLTFKDVDSEEEINVSDADWKTAYYGIKSVAQIGEDNRMVDFQVYSYSTLHSDTTTEFLTAMKKPVIYRGLPFSLCALMGRNDEAVYERNSKLSGVYVDRIINYAEHGVYVLNIANPASNLNAFNIKLITGDEDKHKFIDIDEDGNDLLIDENGNKLRNE